MKRWWPDFPFSNISQFRIYGGGKERVLLYHRLLIKPNHVSPCEQHASLIQSWTVNRIVALMLLWDKGLTQFPTVFISRWYFKLFCVFDSLIYTLYIEKKKRFRWGLWSYYYIWGNFRTKYIIMKLPSRNFPFTFWFFDIMKFVILFVSNLSFHQKKNIEWGPKLNRTS